MFTRKERVRDLIQYLHEYVGYDESEDPEASTEYNQGWHDALEQLNKML